MRLQKVIFGTALLSFTWLIGVQSSPAWSSPPIAQSSSVGAASASQTASIPGRPRPASARHRSKNDLPPRFPQFIGRNPNIGAIPTVGERGITETIAQIMAREQSGTDVNSHPIVDIDPDEGEDEEHEDPDRTDLPQNPDSDTDEVWTQGTDPFNPQIPGVSFSGVSFNGAIPPDTMGAVGPTQYLVVVNGRVRVFSKTGVQGSLNVTLNAFFVSVRNAQGCGDPFVRFDRISNRWFVSCVTVNTPNRVLLAVSSGPTLVNTASFTFYFFQHDLIGSTPNADTGGFCDYPSLGVDANAVYIGGNIFNPGFIGSSVYVIQKSSVLSGGPIVATPFRQVAPNGGSGPYSPRGVSNDDPASTEGYFIGPDVSLFGLLTMVRISTPGGTPTISGNLNITVPATRNPITVPQTGSAARMDALDDRLFYATIFKNQLAGTRTLWTAHNFQVNASGNAAVGGGRNGSRWYEIGSLTTVPALVQSGTLFDSAASNPDSYWIPSVAMSLQGHMAIGCSVSGANRHPEAAVAGRLASDALNATQAPTTIATSSTIYTLSDGSRVRWGDYSATNVDPADGMTIWTIQEFCNATDSWGCQVVQLKAPPPATASSCVPPSVAQGASSVNVTVTGTSAAGSGFFDPDVSYPNHISATVDGGGVTVNSVTFIDPTTLTLNVTVSGGAALGFRTITVTNPDAQVVTSASGILEIITSCALLGDINGDGNVNGDDAQLFADCMQTGSAPGGNCACADMNSSGGAIDGTDLSLFVNALLGI